ncbi:unnamed protein product, partial [Amoebophrya sp. A120]
ACSAGAGKNHASVSTSEYFTISSTGVVHIAPNQPSEQISLANWLHQRLILSVCRPMKFFKNWRKYKMLQIWFRKAKYGKFVERRKLLQRNCFYLKPLFAPVIAEIFQQMAMKFSAGGVVASGHSTGFVSSSNVGGGNVVASSTSGGGVSSSTHGNTMINATSGATSTIGDHQIGGQSHLNLNLLGTKTLTRLPVTTAGATAVLQSAASHHQHSNDLKAPPAVGSGASATHASMVTQAQQAANGSGAPNTAGQLSVHV